MRPMACMAWCLLSGRPSVDDAQRNGRIPSESEERFPEACRAQFLGKARVQRINAKATHRGLVKRRDRHHAPLLSKAAARALSSRLGDPMRQLVVIWDSADDV